MLYSRQIRNLWRVREGQALWPHDNLPHKVVRCQSLIDGCGLFRSLGLIETMGLFCWISNGKDVFCCLFLVEKEILLWVKDGFIIHLMLRQHFWFMTATRINGKLRTKAFMNGLKQKALARFVSIQTVVMYMGLGILTWIQSYLRVHQRISCLLR